ncbi:cell division protein FtsL [Paracoccus spongiarum]|uniref:Cell division protein FtsL n=1 Tax=Paracoccus spongiarum TaxID=3064387 RepID=A0ABT9JCY5_9RHOB|nr:cell division protein FtsL [Paracoccus sp. 2205BS29-5]MDP5307668.1 cell division protein FtsL [Paracoccus sp. 2205BS29-5]
MRPLTYVAVLLAVMALAFWAYRENYRTQAAISEMSQLRREIAGLREELGVLRAEWAYLNRPDRLRDLVNLNFDRLRLVPVDSGQFLDLGQIDYAKPPAAPETDDSDSSKEQQP